MTVSQTRLVFSVWGSVGWTFCRMILYWKLLLFSWLTESYEFWGGRPQTWSAILLLSEKHLCCFQILMIMNKAAINICIWVQHSKSFLQTAFRNSSATCPLYCKLNLVTWHHCLQGRLANVGFFCTQLKWKSSMEEGGEEPRQTTVSLSPGAQPRPRKQRGWRKYKKQWTSSTQTLLLRASSKGNSAATEL